MTPSKYQQAIFDWIKNPSGHLIVKAVAGSGKTTTAIKSLEQLDPTSKVFFGTFTNTIADELKRRVPKNVLASTLSSFGFGCVRNHWRGRYNIDKDKTQKILQWDVMRFKELNSESKKEYYKVKMPVTKVIGLLKAQAYTERTVDFGLVAELCEKHGIEVPALKAFDWRTLVQETWLHCVSEHTWIDFDDMLYYPILHNMAIEKYDWVFIDEAQDLNPCQIQLVSRMVNHTGHIVAIGDDYQAIYGFRGADVDAIDKLAVALKATHAPLSICYRCSKEVVKAAQAIVPHIEASDKAPEGSVTTTKDFKPMDGDYALCRTTAPLVQNCLRMIREGRRAKVLGREIGTGLIAFIESLGLRPEDNLVRFSEAVEEFRRTNVGRLKSMGRDVEAAAIGDKCDTLIALGTRTDNVAGIIKQINDIFSDSASPGVTFATVHKSKGLEAKTVYILHPELLPHPSAKKPWQVKQEENLKYVAITRAQEHLIWVNECSK